MEGKIVNRMVVLAVLVGLSVSVLGKESQGWETVFEETFSDNPISRFHIQRGSHRGQYTAEGRSAYLKEAQAYRVAGYLGLVRPVRAGPHVE